MRANIFVVINTFYQMTNSGGFPITKIRFMSNDLDRCRDFYVKIHDESDFDRHLIHLDKVLCAIPMNRDTEADDFEEEVIEFEDFNRTPRLTDNFSNLSLRDNDQVKIEIVENKVLSQQAQTELKNKLNSLTYINLDDEDNLYISDN
jgi:hypothetical protein